MATTLKYTVLLTALLAALTPAVPAAEGWETNMKAAMAKAAKEGKDLLIDFTGSDWCRWCIRLDKEVFSQAAFKDEAPKKYVLVSLDFPTKKKLPKAQQEQNNHWRDKFGVRGYPSIYLADAKGRPYAKTGYQRGGAQKYMTHLKELQAKKTQRDDLLAKALKATGLDRARLLDQALAVVDESLLAGCYRDTVDQIIKLDGRNQAGLHAKYTHLVTMALSGKLFLPVRKLIQGKKFAKAIKVAEATVKKNGFTGEAALPFQMVKVTIAMSKRDNETAVKEIELLFKQLNPTGQVAQNLWFQKGSLLSRFNRAEALKCLHEALKAAPEGKLAGRIKGILARNKK